jgi:ATP-dependent helicase YprA (DUF1998 family)
MESSQGSISTQHNGILAKHVDKPSTFELTQWGVYDFVEQTSPGENMVDVQRIVDSEDYLFQEIDEDIEEDLRENPELVSNIQSIFEAIPDGLGITELYAIQWAAIQERVRMLLDDEKGSLVVRAPTSAGKTAIYFVSTALVILQNDTRAFLPFPTTTLTDGMLSRMIRFVHALREYGDVDVSCGVVMGKDTNPDKIGLDGPDSDDWEQNDVYLDAAELGDYFEACPNCQEWGDDSETPNLSVHRECAKCGGIVREGWTNNGHHAFKCSDTNCDSTSARHYIVCDDCDYEYEYVHAHDSTARYHPDIVVGTPDKLFSMATLQGYSEHSTYSRLPFFGAPHTRCDSCNRVLTDMNGYGAQEFGGDGVWCKACEELSSIDWNIVEGDLSDAEFDPIGHVVLDENHMYTGEFGAGISVIIEFLRILATRFRQPEQGGSIDHDISVDAGTATTSNALEHIRNLIRDENHTVVPSEGEKGEYFEVEEDEVRYRLLAMKPVGTTNRNTFRRGMVNTYDLLNNDSSYQSDFEGEISSSSADAEIEDFQLLLGYLFRRNEGYAAQSTIRDLLLDELDEDMEPPFMSGDMPKAERREILNDAEALEQPMILANMVVSLGLDIERLNNMIMYGTCQSTAEQMQAMGRTGRKDAAGHATVHLYPNKPRDEHMYSRFHSMLSSMEEYVEPAIIQPTNPHVAMNFFHSLLSPLLTIQMAHEEANPDHKVKHLQRILRDAMSLEEVEDEYEEAKEANEFHARLLEDFRRVFVPDDIQIPERLESIMYSRLKSRYIDYFDEDSGDMYEADGNIRLNIWFQEESNRGGILRGESGTRVSTKVKDDYGESPQ